LIQQLILHEEKLLAQRLMIFLLLNSILVIAFVSLLGSEFVCFERAISILGIIFSILLPLHTLRVKKIIDFYQKEAQKSEEQTARLQARREEQLGQYGKYTRWLRGNNTGFIFGIIFLSFWVFCLVKLILN
jgi:hypothetical protein